MAVTQAASLAGDYSTAAATWSAGPGSVYDVLAEHLVAASGVLVPGCAALDAGCGDGAASVALLRRGAQVTALDVIAEPPRVRELAIRFVRDDIRAMPFATSSFDVGVAAFSLNHVDPPAAGLAELRRVVRRGGTILASSFAREDEHPVKAAVDGALRAAGWRPPAWYEAVQRGPVQELSTVHGFTLAAAMAGLDASIARHEIAFPGLDADALVSWRLGMAQAAPFVANHDESTRADLRAAALDALGDPPPLVRTMLILHAVR